MTNTYLEGIKHFPMEGMKKRLSSLYERDKSDSRYAGPVNAGGISFLFYKTIAQALCKGGSSDVLEVLIDLLLINKGVDDHNLTEGDIEAVFNCMYKCSLISMNVPFTDEECSPSSFSTIAKSSHRNSSGGSRNLFISWVTRYFPWIGRVVSTCFYPLFIPPKASSPGVSPNRVQVASVGSNIPSLILSKQDIFLLSLTRQPLCETKWDRLYYPENGLSFNRLSYHIENYGGPSLLVIRDTNGFVFGGYASVPWEEKNDFYGNSDCFLFALFPSFNVYNPESNAGSRSNFMVLSSTKHFQVLTILTFERFSYSVVSE